MPKHKFNAYMQSGLFYLSSLDRSIFNIRGVWIVLLITMFNIISVSNANSEDPDQTPHSVSSDLGLHCLPMSLLWDARLKWVKTSEMSKYFQQNFVNLIRAV